MAEKLAWGYEGVEPNPGEGLKLFRRAAGPGVSDALVRIGQLQEQGRGTARDLNAAVKSYASAARAGNFLALAFLAKLLSRGSLRKEAEELWDRFIAAFEAKPEHGYLAAEPGELLHA